jgi:predicted membrane-bound dolichyl-phosphate-mannose-protein mannosyltransferase
MEIAKRLLYRLGKWEYSGLCLLVIVILALHFSIIMQPAELVFDELYYVEDARSILQGEDVLRPEHPPLGTLLITFGIFLFGDNPFGWRFFSILFGTIGIVLFYLICRRLELPKMASFLATFLLALDNLSFVQASVAMLDVYSVTFMLLSFWLYLRGQYLLSGLSVGLSALAKLSGVLALPVILLHWLLTKRGRPIKFVATMLSAYVALLLLLPLFDFVAFRQFVNPLDRIYTMLSLSGKLTFTTATHGAASHPWDWILRPEIIAYWYEPHYVGAISFTIWALIIPTVLYMVFKATKGNSAGFFGIAWFVSTYLVWIPISIVTDRISFVYYFYPTVGAVCIGLGLGLFQLLAIWKTRRTGKLRWVAVSSVIGYLLLHISVFVILSPVFSHWITLPTAQ